ncbi:MAG: sensor histidine kinase KdpD [Pirellulaceae bacterium]|nr:sensor histidine kinase KdpD [Pirellulaceae bacterium]
MPGSRPNPDELLAQVKAEEADALRGSLKVFFGYAAGVGKTYSMLENAQRAKAEGREVVVGYVEPHGRSETEALLAGLEAIPVREYDYRGVPLREFDVDAALARCPDLMLVDELAHTNAAGCRHAKRWQDVEELLAAGIDVWTTLNVQHIESLNDVIGQITGVTVRETVPDRVFDLADDLELVDITPEELLQRLQAGKVYVPEQAQRAIQSFFQKSNLTALRELSLRQAARRIHTDVESARRARAAIQPWATADRLLVCVGPSPTTARVIRTARRMAAALDAPWLAVSVDLTGAPSSNPAKQQISQHFRLAERLGAETVTLAGRTVTDTILEYARSRNVTKILIGKTNQPRWRRLIFGTVVDDVLENSGDIDVYVIHGDEERTEHAPTHAATSSASKLPYLYSCGLIGLTGCIAHGLRFLHLADAEANTVMLFLATVAWTAYRHGRGPAILASFLAVLVFDFFFIPPFHTFAVADAQYVVTFAVMLAIGLVISTLTSRLRAQIESTRHRERRTSALYELGKQLSSLYGNVFLAGAAGGKIAELLGGEVAIYLRRTAGSPELAFGHDSSIARHSVSVPVAQWVIEHDHVAGAGTNTLPNAVALFFPLTGSQGTHGAIAVRVADAERLLDPEVRRLLEACASQLALALERDQLAIEAADARIKAEAEQVRSSLLSSVSHDLKTPLAAIAGASSSLLEAASLDEDTRRQLLETVADEADRLNRLLENILHMSKLEAGAATPNRQWHVLEELVGSALHRTRRELANHEVAVHLPNNLPLLFVDGLLMEQVFVNLLENAARYTPAGTQVAIRAAIDGKHLRIAVSDDGPGLPSGAEQRIFDKFFRATSTADGGRGSGLGLAICRAIIHAHGGTITAANRPVGGAEFVMRLPLAKDAPQVVVE